MGLRRYKELTIVIWHQGEHFRPEGRFYSDCLPVSLCTVHTMSTVNKYSDGSIVDVRVLPEYLKYVCITHFN